MNAITRDIILDLLPAYLAGEASGDTRKLVDEFAAGDAQIARLIRANGNDTSLNELKLTLPADGEARALRQTRNRLRRQSWLLGCAIFFTAMSISFQWSSETGIHYTFVEFPAVASASLAVGIGLWIGYFSSRRRLASQGL